MEGFFFPAGSFRFYVTVKALIFQGHCEALHSLIYFYLSSVEQSHVLDRLVR